MCGIVGTDGGTLYPMMAHSIKHRGKYIYTYLDDHRTQVDFIHLPILDHLNGRQPFTYNGWFCWFNGEIYNYKELCKKYSIETYGYCDGEVIAKLVDKIGLEKAVKEFNGMFAIYIEKEGNKYLIRDRYGIKPMYYTTINGNLYFASEIKALTRHPNFKSEVDYEALREYMLYQNILSDRTLFKGVKLLPPATIYKIGSEYRTYWKPEINPTKMDFEEAKQEVRRLLEQSIKRQLQTDTTIASFLSGGIDSNIIRGLAGDSIDNTFTAGFMDGITEHKIAELNGANIHNVEMFNRLSIKQYLNDTIYHLEDLRVGASYVNYALYGKVAQQGHTVVLQGTGGDEIFNGYTHRYDMTKDYREVLNRNQYYNNGEIEWSNDSLNKRLEFDIRHFLHGLLIVGDKLSMAHTLEDRVPFLDNDLVDFALTIPNSMKVDKWVLKSSCMDVIPQEVLNNKKWGFTSPEHIWFEANKDWIKSELKNVWEVVDIPKHPMNYSLTWSLLSLEYWLRNYIIK